MSSSQQKPWAILLCKFKDDSNDPYQTQISDLYQQWEAQNGAFWVSQNLRPAAASDNRKIIEVYRQFFTNVGSGTFNAVRYWDEMSHGTIDINGTQIFPCTLDITKVESPAQYAPRRACRSLGQQAHAQIGQWLQARVLLPYVLEEYLATAPLPRG